MDTQANSVENRKFVLVPNFSFCPFSFLLVSLLQPAKAILSDHQKISGKRLQGRGLSPYSGENEPILLQNYCSSFCWGSNTGWMGRIKYLFGFYYQLRDSNENGCVNESKISATQSVSSSCGSQQPPRHPSSQCAIPYTKILLTFPSSFSKLYHLNLEIERWIDKYSRKHCWKDLCHTNEASVD